jgi:hypothetical protein
MRESLARTFANRALCLLLAISIPSSSFAGMVRLEGEMNGRSTASFRGSRNVISRVPRGTEGHVLERFALPSGNYGIKLKITTLGPGKAKNLKVGQEIWVYYHEKKKSLRRVALYDDDKKLVESAVDGNWAKASETFSVSGLKSGEDCDGNCSVKSTEDQGTGPITQEQKKSLDEVVDVVEKGESGKIPEDDLLDPSVEEIVAFLDTQRPKQKDTNRRIAKAVIASAKKHGVSVPLVIALMKVESQFYVKARSRVGAQGLLQLMPSTARNVNRFDIEDNVEFGVKYLKGLLDKYDGNERYAVGAYNCGEGRFDEYLKREKGIKVAQSGRRKGRLNRPLPTETSRHIAKVMSAKSVYVAFSEKYQGGLDNSKIASNESGRDDDST